MTRLVAALVLVGAVAAGAGQSGNSLSALTVPAAALPNGCALTPPPASPAFSQFPANPWSGTDRKIVAAVHRAIDPAPSRPLPDVPPETARDRAASDLRWADNILEGYHAAYAAADGLRVEVFAVTFNDLKLTTAPESLSALLNPPRGLTARLVRGATLVRVSAPTSARCFEAVRAHVESLK